MMTQKKAMTTYKTVGFLLTALCLVLSYVYRPYAYAHHLNDFHLSDCYTSFFGVPIVACLTQGFKFFRNGRRWSIPKTIICSIGLFMIWEFADGLLAKSMDWIDIAASWISGGLMYVAYLIFGFKSVEDYKSVED